MAKNFVESLMKVDETMHNPVVTKEGRNGGTYAVHGEWFTEDAKFN